MMVFSKLLVCIPFLQERSEWNVFNDRIFHI